MPPVSRATAGRARLRRRTPALIALAVFGLPPTAVAEEVALAAQVADAVSGLRADLEEMRFVMGAPVAASARWQVSDAAPRHALATAETSFAKVHRLAFEVAGEPLAAPPAPGAAPSAAVLATVAGAREHLRGLMVRVGVEPVAPSGRSAPSATWADALVEMVEANRQLNAMLVHEYRPAEIYDVVVESIRLVAGIADASYPRLPRLAVGKTSTDVYQRLLDCFQLARQLEAQRDMTTLGLNLRRERRRENVPSSEAYDLSRLLLADIAGMGRGLASAPNAAPPYQRPRYIYSAHVHRLADVLAEMLTTLGQ